MRLHLTNCSRLLIFAIHYSALVSREMAALGKHSSYRPHAQFWKWNVKMFTHTQHTSFGNGAHQFINNFDEFWFVFIIIYIIHYVQECIEIQNIKMNKQDTKPVILCFLILEIPLDLNQSSWQIQIKDIISDFITLMLTLHEIG